MKNRLWLFIVLVLMFAAASCATTTLQRVWKDPDLKMGTIRKMMVVGIAREPATRRLFEDSFAQSLAAHGVSVIKSYEVMTLEELNGREGAAEKIRALGAEAVLATRLVSQETYETYDQRPYGVWRGYYGMSYSSLVAAGYIQSNEVARLETNVYDIKTEKRAWAALSDTWMDMAELDRLITDFSAVMVRRMTKDGLIPAAEKK